MHPNPSRGATERALLAYALARHPERLTIYDLALEFGGEGEAALDALVSSGLLRREADAVLPTPAALHFERLESL